MLTRLIINDIISNPQDITVKTVSRLFPCNRPLLNIMPTTPLTAGIQAFVFDEVVFANLSDLIHEKLTAIKTKMHTINILISIISISKLDPICNAIVLYDPRFRIIAI